MMRAKLAMTVLAVAVAVDGATPAMAEGDAALGQKLFLQCQACHTIDKAGTNSIGPNLRGVFGAKAAAKSDYPYSPALAQLGRQSGLVWTSASLDTFLTRPSAMVPGTKMAFAGIAAKPLRLAVIAYLATLTGPRH